MWGRSFIWRGISLATNGNRSRSRRGNRRSSTSRLLRARSRNDSGCDMAHKKKDEIIKGRPMAIDPEAASASVDGPAFLNPPDGARVYHGFPILKDVVSEGFCLGKITDFEAEHCDSGDAFVVAPDNSRAGIVWEVSNEPHFSEILRPDSRRWGVWAVNFPHPMTSRDDARRNFAFILPQLKEKWESWRRRM